MRGVEENEKKRTWTKRAYGVGACHAPHKAYTRRGGGGVTLAPLGRRSTLKVNTKVRVDEGRGRRGTLESQKDGYDIKKVSLFLIGCLFGAMPT